MKTDVRESSHEAFDSLKTADLGRQQKQVVAAVALLLHSGQHTDGWVSRRQVAHLLEMETSTVAARVNALLAAKRLIEDDMLRKCPVTRRGVHMVSIPEPEGRAAA